MSRGVWKVVETKAGKIRIAKTKRKEEKKKKKKRKSRRRKKKQKRKRTIEVKKVVKE